MKHYKPLLLILLVAALGLLTFGNTFCEQKDAKITEFYKEIELFSDAISYLWVNYVDTVEPKKLIYGALKGMLSSLDGYSQFMDPDSYKELKEDTKGEFGGLGIEIGIREGMLTIIAPMEGTPAHQAGLMPKDVIVKIDGEVTKDIVIHEAVKKLRGKRGTSVDLTIWREKEERFFDVTVVRAIIELKSIKKSVVIEDDVGYIKVVDFQQDTAKEFEQALKKLTAKGVKGLILDLRNNAGGLLDVAIELTDILLEKGEPIVSTKGRIIQQNKQFIAQSNTPYTKITLAILVNEGSASASEIVAGAIKDNKRGIIVGQKTFGKGSVQTVIPLRDGSALRVTTANYFTPGGYIISKKGVKPDILVELHKKELAKAKEEDEKAIFEKLKKPKEEKDLKDKDIDNQVKAAVDIIKAINIYRENI